MSIMAAKELEDAASKYAAEAIRVDSQGAHGRAIVLYQSAISTLIRLAQLYPDYKLNKLYLDRSMAYQERIKALQSAHGSIPQDRLCSPDYRGICQSNPEASEIG